MVKTKIFDEEAGVRDEAMAARHGDLTEQDRSGGWQVPPNLHTHDPESVSLTAAQQERVSDQVHDLSMRSAITGMFTLITSEVCLTILLVVFMLVVFGPWHR